VAEGGDEGERRGRISSFAMFESNKGDHELLGVLYFLVKGKRGEGKGSEGSWKPLSEYYRKRGEEERNIRERAPQPWEERKKGVGKKEGVRMEPQEVNVFLTEE